MKYRRMALVLALVVLGALALAGPVVAQGGRTLSTGLNGAEEVPGPGDPDGSGSAKLTLNPGAETICYSLTVSDIEPATAAHIHVGPAGEAGPVVVGLDPPTDGSSSGCATADRALILNILKDPSNYYVNVHNAEYMSGAIRGQLSR